MSLQADRTITQSTPILLASLMANLVLFGGDVMLGVFSAFGAPQVAVISTVLLITSFMLWVSTRQPRAAIDALMSE